MKHSKGDLKLNEEVRMIRYQMSQFIERLETLEGEAEQNQVITSDTFDMLVNVFLELILEETKGTITDEGRMRLKGKFEKLQKEWLST